MMLSGIRLTVSFLVLCIASSTGAQESLDKGKTAAQLYATDCAICHKSPQSITPSARTFWARKLPARALHGQP